MGLGGCVDCGGVGSGVVVGAVDGFAVLRFRSLFSDRTGYLVFYMALSRFRNPFWFFLFFCFNSYCFVWLFGGGFDRGFLYSCFLFVFLFVVCFLFFRFRLCNGQEKAHLCRLAEHNFLNMPCGIMDQFVTSMAVPGD